MAGIERRLLLSEPGHKRIQPVMYGLIGILVYSIALFTFGNMGAVAKSPPCVVAQQVLVVCGPPWALFILSYAAVNAIRTRKYRAIILPALTVALMLGLWFVLLLSHRLMMKEIGMIRGH